MELKNRPFPSNALAENPIRGQKTLRSLSQNIINLGKIPALRYLIIGLLSGISGTLLQISSTLPAFCSPSPDFLFQDA